MGTRRRNDVDATSLRRIDVVTTSCACWEFAPPLGPPKILNLGPPQYSKPSYAYVIILSRFCISILTGASGEIYTPSHDVCCQILDCKCLFYFYRHFSFRYFLIYIFLSSPKGEHAVAAVSVTLLFGAYQIKNLKVDGPEQYKRTVNLSNVITELSTH